MDAPTWEHLEDIHIKKPIKIHVDADENDCSAVLVQGESTNNYRVVQMLGRELTATEAKCSLIEKLLLCAAM